MRKYLGILVIVLITALLGVQTVPAWVPPTCGAGETLVEHYWYEDHFDDDATISDWVGDDPDMSNWQVVEGNSTLEASDGAPSYYLMKGDAKFGIGNYSFRIRDLFYPDFPSYEQFIVANDFTLASYIDIYGSNHYSVSTFNNKLALSNLGNVIDEPDYLVPLNEWNWFNYTYYESGGDSIVDWYINNTLIGVATDPGYIYDPGYIIVSPDGSVYQYDYISYSNWSCEAESVPIPDRFPGDHLSCSVNKTGDNFIWWWWSNSSMESAPNLTETVFLNGNPVVQNGTLGYYLATGLNPDEEHVLELWGFNQTLNTLNTTCICTDKTYEQDIWTLLYIGCALIVIGWFTAPLLILLSCGVFLLGFGMAYDMTTQSYIILTYGIGFFFSMITFYLRWNY